MQAQCADLITMRMEIAPRGFANEVTCIPVPESLRHVAEGLVSKANNNTSAWGTLAEIKKPYLSESETHQAEMMLLMGFDIDPNAYDFINGYWEKV